MASIDPLRPEHFYNMLNFLANALDAPGVLVRGAIGDHLPDVPTPDPTGQPGFVQSALHQLTQGGTPEDATTDWRARAQAQAQMIAELRAMRDNGASGTDVFQHFLDARGVPDWEQRYLVKPLTNPVNLVGLGLPGRAMTALQVAERLPWAAGAVKAIDAADTVIGNVPVPRPGGPVWEGASDAWNGVRSAFAPSAPTADSGNDGQSTATIGGSDLGTRFDGFRRYVTGQ
jgi:hypothetical protein